MSSPSSQSKLLETLIRTGKEPALVHGAQAGLTSPYSAGLSLSAFCLPGPSGLSTEEVAQGLCQEQVSSRGQEAFPLQAQAAGPWFTRLSVSSVAEKSCVSPGDTQVPPWLLERGGLCWQVAWLASCCPGGGQRRLCGSSTSQWQMCKVLS